MFLSLSLSLSLFFSLSAGVLAFVFSRNKNPSYQPEISEFLASASSVAVLVDGADGVHSTPVLPQWHVKDPGHSAKSASGRFHLNTHTSLTQRSRSGLTLPLSRHSVGTYQVTSSHATRQGTLGHSRLSLLSHCRLTLA